MKEHEYMNEELDYKEFLCMSGAVLLTKEISKTSNVTYYFGGFRDEQSISIISEEITQMNNEVSVNPTNFFLNVNVGETIELPNSHVGKENNVVFEVMSLYPERNSIRLRELTVSYS